MAPAAETMRPDRVVIINDFAEVRGGASSQAVKLARGLARRGIEVCFFSGEAQPKETEHRITHVTLNQEKLVDLRAHEAIRIGLNNAAALDALKKLIADCDSPGTVYHVHGWGQILSPSIFSALSEVSNRVVLHAHDLSMACPNIVYFNFRTGKICDRVPMSLGCLVSNCDKRSRGQKVWRYARHKIYRERASDLRKTAPVIAVHEAMEPFLRLGGVRGEIITVRNTANALLSAPVKAERNDAFVFLGQVLSFKGVFDLARAAELAGVRLVVIGDGTDLSEMKRLCPSAEFKGWKSAEELRDLMQVARALVVPTRGIEPFGVVVVEAAKSGIPVIVSDGLLLAEDVNRLGFGLTYPAGDVEALAETLKYVASDDILVARLSRAAEKHGGSLSPSEEEWIDQIGGVYSRVLEGSHAPTAIRGVAT